MPDPLLPTLVHLVIHEEHGSISSKQYDKFPEEEQSKEIQRKESHVSVQNDPQGTAIDAVIVMHSVQ